MCIRDRAWVDLEWDLEVPPALADCLSHVRLLRSVHVGPGVFDLERRLERLPRGDAFKWVGHAASPVSYTHLDVYKRQASGRPAYVSVPP